MRTYGFLYIINHGLSQTQVHPLCNGLYLRSFTLTFRTTSRQNGWSTLQTYSSLKFQMMSSSVSPQRSRKLGLTEATSLVSSGYGTLFITQRMWPIAETWIHLDDRQWCARPDRALQQYDAVRLLHDSPTSHHLRAVHHPIFYQQHPQALQPFLPEIRAFAEHNHYNILHPILRYAVRGIRSTVS